MHGYDRDAVVHAAHDPWPHFCVDNSLRWRVLKMFSPKMFHIVYSLEKWCVFIVVVSFRKMNKKENVMRNVRGRHYY